MAQVDGSGTAALRLSVVTSLSLMGPLTLAYTRFWVKSMLMLLTYRGPPRDTSALLGAVIIQPPDVAIDTTHWGLKPSARQWPIGASSVRALTTPAKAYNSARWSAWSMPTTSSNTSFSARMGAA